jgi:hypothetical protein
MEVGDRPLRRKPNCAERALLPRKAAATFPNSRILTEASLSAMGQTVTHADDLLCERRRQADF